MAQWLVTTCAKRSTRNAGCPTRRRRIVRAGQPLMAMRQAAYLPGTRAGSAKLARLLEIAEEAMATVGT